MQYVLTLSKCAINLKQKTSDPHLCCWTRTRSHMNPVRYSNESFIWYKLQYSQCKMLDSPSVMVNSARTFHSCKLCQNVYILAIGLNWQFFLFVFFFNISSFYFSRVAGCYQPNSMLLITFFESSDQYWSGSHVFRRLHFSDCVQDLFRCRSLSPQFCCYR